MFSPNNNSIIGFTDTSIDNGSEMLIAKYMLVVYVKGVAGTLSRSLAFYPTHTAKAYELVSIMWGAIEALETRCNLKVVALVCDGSSNNQVF